MFKNIGYFGKIEKLNTLAKFYGKKYSPECRVSEYSGRAKICRVFSEKNTR